MEVRALVRTLLSQYRSSGHEKRKKVTKRAPVPMPKKEPLIYISVEQANVKYRRLKELIKQYSLPVWVPARQVADALGYSQTGVDIAQASLGGTPYLWATEFENVHSNWIFSEPKIQVDGNWYENSETYYHEMKPRPFDEGLWIQQRERVMYTACRAKLVASPHLRDLLLKTHPHPLLSIKSDRVWGFDATSSNPKTQGGQNLLALIWMRIRAEELDGKSGHP